MNPDVRLTILFDCCHSGSACELPFVFRPDAEGNIDLIDQLKKGLGLVREANHLLQGGWSRDKISDAKMLLGGATDFFNGLHHARNAAVDAEGLAPESFQEHWEREGKDVWMFSGCRDDQTSADATISGTATGAMSWAFLGTMRERPDQSYREVCIRLLAGLGEMECDAWMCADGGAGLGEYATGSDGQLFAGATVELRRALRSRPASLGESIPSINSPFSQSLTLVVFMTAMRSASPQTGQGRLGCRMVAK